jgi:hypothetical protein
MDSHLRKRERGRSGVESVSEKQKSRNSRVTDRETWKRWYRSGCYSRNLHHLNLLVLSPLTSHCPAGRMEAQWSNWIDLS